MAYGRYVTQNVYAITHNIPTRNPSKKREKKYLLIDDDVDNVWHHTFHEEKKKKLCENGVKKKNQNNNDPSGIYVYYDSVKFPLNILAIEKYIARHSVLICEHSSKLYGKRKKTAEKLLIRSCMCVVNRKWFKKWSNNLQNL